MMQLMNKQDKAAYVETLPDVANGKPGKGWNSAEGWRRYYMQREFIDAGDCVIQVERPGIDNVIWYDDETPDPFGTDDVCKKECFFEHNMSSNFHDREISAWLECERDLQERGCCSGRHLSEPFVAVWPSGEAYPVFMGHMDEYEADSRRFGMKIRPMSEDERDELIAIYDELESRYRKRLETYWKRYGEKVTSRGYWANR